MSAIYKHKTEDNLLYLVFDEPLDVVVISKEFNMASRTDADSLDPTPDAVSDEYAAYLRELIRVVLDYDSIEKANLTQGKLDLKDLEPLSDDYDAALANLETLESKIADITYVFNKLNEIQLIEGGHK